MNIFALYLDRWDILEVWWSPLHQVGLVQFRVESTGVVVWPLDFSDKDKKKPEGPVNMVHTLNGLSQFEKKGVD